jgi:CheY-like chemotaxis protein
MPQEPLDLNRLVADCVTSEALDPTRSRTRTVQLRFDVHPAALVVSGSEGQLTRAITNLIRNGLEAIEGAGTVRVTTSRVVLTEPHVGFETVPPGDYAVVMVSDTGTGIRATDLPRVFEPFFTNKRTSERTGTGLGLAIVHGVIKEHRGFVDVATVAPGGTKFSLYLPRVDQAPRPSTVVSAAPSGRGRILLVDDERVQLRTASRILARAGYDVDSVESGKTACQLFTDAHARGKASVPPQVSQRSLYDLVILDMILNEELDGLQVLEELRKRYPAQRALLVSGHAPSHRLEMAIGGGLSWLAKPYTNDALLKAVHAALALPSPDTE